MDWVLIPRVLFRIFSWQEKWLRYLDAVEVPLSQEFDEIERALDEATRTVRSGGGGGGDS